MTDVAKLVDGYIEMWNETDPERRRALVAQTLTDDASYVDPRRRLDRRPAPTAPIGARPAPRRRAARRSPWIGEVLPYREVLATRKMVARTTKRHRPPVARDQQRIQDT